MKNVCWLLVCCFAICVICSSCLKRTTGRGPVVTENRHVSDYSKVALLIPAELKITQSESFSLTMDAQQNILDMIETEVSEGELKLRFGNGGSVSDNDRIVMKLSAPSIERVYVNGDGTVNVLGTLNVASLALAVNGDGAIVVARVEASDNIEVKSTGYGDIAIAAGNAPAGVAHISGFGHIDLLGVNCQNMKATLSGKGEVKATVSSLLDVEISGKGMVYYKGSPVVNANISGSGSVRKL